MITSRPVPKTIEKDRTFFSAYLNLATHNAFLLIADASKKMGFKVFNGDNWGALTKGGTLIDALQNSDKTKQVAILEYFIKRMPFLDWMAGCLWYIDQPKKDDITIPNPEDIDIAYKKDAFIKILMELWSYRNWTTHYKADRPAFNKNTLSMLRSAFDASVRHMKEERFGYTPEEAAHLVRYDKQNKKSPSGVRLDRADFRYSFYDQDADNLSQNGIIYLTCLFLERRYSQLFLKQIRGFKDSTDRQKQATLNTFSGYSIRLPRTTVVSADSRNALLLDTFNELIKAPNSLFNQHLSETKKDIFRPNISIEPDSDITEEQTTLLVRRKNRFNFFALNFLDNLEILDNFRFQILYGRFYFHTYESEIPRKLHKGLYAFARMKDVIAFKSKLKQQHPHLFKDSKDLPKDYHQPYILDFPPRFPWDEDEIVFSLREKEMITTNIIQKIGHNKYARPKSNKADIILSMNELPAFMFFILLHLNTPEFRNNVSKEVEINSILRKWQSGLRKFLKRIINRELQPIAKPTLQNALRNKSATPTEKDAFNKEFNERKQLINKWLEPYHLNTTMIPDRIRDYLMKIEPASSSKKVAGILKNMIAESESQIEKLDKKLKFRKSQKAGQQGSRPILTGKLADFIAKDIVYFQKKVADKKNDGKPNSDQFQAIQVALAKWPYSKDDFLALANQFNYFSPTVHPFLTRSIFDASQFIQVYKNYLNARINYLKEQQELKTPLHQLEFLHISTTNDVRVVAQKILNDHPMPIPKSWFLWESVRFIKKQFPEMADDLEKISNLSTPKLIQFWFEKKFQDKNQSFYDFKRNYPIFDNWRDQRRKSRDKKQSVFLDLDQREDFFREVKQELKASNQTQIKKGQTTKTVQDWRKQLKSYVRNESILKLQASQDILLYLMGLELFKKSTGDIIPSNFPKLHSFLPEKRAKGEVSNRTSQPLEHPIDEYSMRIEAKDYSLIIKEKNVKMKDFGKFKKVAYDRRISELIPFLCDENQKQAEISLTKLEEEFHAYEQKRLDVLTTIYNFEETMATSVTHKNEFDNLLLAKSSDTVPAVQHGLYIDRLTAYGFSEDEKNEMKALRNAFSHNQYPSKSAIASLSIDKNKSIIEQIANFAIEKYETAIEKIRVHPDNRPF